MKWTSVEPPRKQVSKSKWNKQKNKNKFFKKKENRSNQPFRNQVKSLALDIKSATFGAASKIKEHAVASFTKPNEVGNDKVTMETQLLPIQQCKSRLIQEFGNHSTFIIVGETGSGKSTQIPQFILDSGAHKKKCIAVTQPRRIAAISLAKRVAEERNNEVGRCVGYSVRFEDATSGETQIKFLTDGMLLREAMLDNKLMKYSWIILDEAHERSISTEVLFGVVKNAQAMRNGLKTKKRLKIILMSATMDVSAFEKFYPNAKVLYARGREHPVTIHYLTKPIDEFESCNIALKTVMKLHLSSLPLDHHILVFMTGKDEIESSAQLMKKILRARRVSNLAVNVLYGALPYDIQTKALESSQRGVRKCIFSTNIAETSLTIPGVRVVVDSGRVKAKYYIKGTSINCLKVLPVSQAQAWQRSGRAGRQGPGACYRLFTTAEYEKMAPFPIPEIQRSSMESVVLQLVKIGLKNLSTFQWVDMPKIEVIREAIDTLWDLGALKSSKEPLELTGTGEFMAKVPLEPKYSKALYQSKSHGVVEPIITILSVLTSESILSSSKGQKSSLKERFRCPEGDLISYLKVYREFKKQRSTRDKENWCKNNHLSFRALQYAAKVRKHLKALCEQENFDLKTSLSGSQLYETIRKCFHESWPKMLAVKKHGNEYLVKIPGSVGVTSRIHHSSVLHTYRPHYVTFCEIVETGRNVRYLSHVSLINPEWVKSS